MGGKGGHPTTGKWWKEGAKRKDAWKLSLLCCDAPVAERTLPHLYVETTSLPPNDEPTGCEHCNIEYKICHPLPDVHVLDS